MCFGCDIFVHTACITYLLESQCLLYILHSPCVQNACLNGCSWHLLSRPAVLVGLRNMQGFWSEALYLLFSLLFVAISQFWMNLVIRLEWVLLGWCNFFAQNTAGISPECDFVVQLKGRCKSPLSQKVSVQTTCLAMVVWKKLHNLPSYQTDFLRTCLIWGL